MCFSNCFLTDVPSEVDSYHSLFPLEPLPPPNRMQKTSNFSYITSCYKAVNSKDDLPYCLRRIHGNNMHSAHTNKAALLISLLAYQPHRKLQLQLLTNSTSPCIFCSDLQFWPITTTFYLQEDESPSELLWKSSCKISHSGPQQSHRKFATSWRGWCIDVHSSFMKEVEKGRPKKIRPICCLNRQIPIGWQWDTLSCA